MHKDSEFLNIKLFSKNKFNIMFFSFILFQDWLIKTFHIYAVQDKTLPIVCTCVFYR